MLNSRELILLIAAWVCTVTGQVPPSNTCPQYFQYIRDGNQFYGEIVFQHLQAGEHNFEVTLSNRGLPRSSYQGSLDPYPDVNAAVQNLLAGRPIKLRLSFPVPSQPPILTSLSLNGRVLCSALGYPVPNSWFQLYYTIQAGFVGSNHMTYPSNFGNALPEFPYRPQYPDWSSVGMRPATSPSRPQFPDFPSVVVIPGRPIYRNPDPSTVKINRPTPTTTTTTTTPPTPTITETRRTDRRPFVQQTQTSYSLNTVDIDAVCGIESPYVSTLIFGGTEVSRGQFPWVAAVYQKSEGDLFFKCGGTLVTRRNVITAAHCVKSFIVTTVTVYLGRNDLVNIEDGILAQDLQEILIHPDYKKEKPDADVAILVMSPLDSFTRFIKPICLWKESVDRARTENLQGTVVGWGINENLTRGNDDSNVARMVDVKIVDNEMCQAFWKDFGDIITERTFCAGNDDGGGPCAGDSGSGLMVLRNDRWTLRGIVSVGQSNRYKCNKKKYAIYCDVAQHRDWIQATLNFN